MDMERFIDEIPKVLLAFSKYVGEALRQYMLRAHVMIVSEVRAFVYYSPNDPALQRASFGRLVSLFARFNSNTELHNSLTQLVEWRNFYAHQAYLTAGGMGDLPADLEGGLDDLEQIRVGSERCLQKLWKEIQQLEARFVVHKKGGV